MWGKIVLDIHCGYSDNFKGLQQVVDKVKQDPCGLLVVFHEVVGIRVSKVKKRSME